MVSNLIIQEKNEIESNNKIENLIEEINGNQEYELNITRNSLQLLADNHDSSYVYKYEKIYRNKSFPEKKININDLDNESKGKDNIRISDIDKKDENEIFNKPNDISVNTINFPVNPKKVMFAKKQVPFTPSVFSISNNEINFDSKVTKVEEPSQNPDVLKANTFNVKEATINNYTNFLISDENSRFAHLKYINNNRHLLPKLGKELKTDSIYSRSFECKNDYCMTNCTNNNVLLKMNSRTNSLNNTINSENADISKTISISNENKNMINNYELKANKRLFDIKLPPVKEVYNDDTNKKFNKTFNLFSIKDNQNNEFNNDANSYYDHIATKYPDTKRKYLSYSVEDLDNQNLIKSTQNDEFKRNLINNHETSINRGNQIEYLNSPLSINSSKSDRESIISKELTKSFSDKLNLSIKSENSFRELNKIKKKSNGEYSQNINDNQNESALRVLQENSNSDLSQEKGNDNSNLKAIMAGLAIAGTIFAGKFILDNHEQINSYFSQRFHSDDSNVEIQSSYQIGQFFSNNWHFMLGFILFLIIFKLSAVLLKSIFRKR